MSISLVREFTEKVRPPRALWVPFPFGRPLGAPGNVKVQRQVVERALALLPSPAPVIADFILDAEDEKLDAKYQTLGRKCGPNGCSLDDILAVEEGATAEPEEVPYRNNLQDVLDEIGGLQRHHGAYREKRRGRTAVGASGYAPHTLHDVARGIDAFIRGEEVKRPGSSAGTEAPEALFVRLMIDDLKAFYMESRVEMAAEESADAARTNDWFWLDTWAGRMIIAARDRFVQVTDRKKDPNWILARAIVPRGYGKSAYTLGHIVGD